MIPARVSIITIGTRDFSTMRAFYRALGWREASVGADHAMFETVGGALALVLADELAVDANIRVPAGECGHSTFSVAINLESRELVDETFRNLRALGVEITREPHETFWGGYSGYFSDPEGNIWEVAWNPYVRFDQRGALDMAISR
jgi:uncharacterized protein